MLGVGTEWLLLHRLNPDIFLDGHAALRVRDVRTVKVLSSTSFAARALKHYGDEPQGPGRVDLTSLRSVIESLSRRFPLITIHTELRDPAVCYVGVQVGITPKGLRLREITPEARWEDEPTTYPLSDITRVEIGGRYEDALLAVVGRPPRVGRD